MWRTTVSFRTLFYRVQAGLPNDRWSLATRAGAPRVVVLLGLIACGLALLPAPVDYPRLFDPDDASQGIFVNDLTFRGDYDASFEGAREYQDAYRGDWAAQRLSYSLPISALQRWLGIARHDVESLLTVLAVLFAVTGCGLAAVALTPGQTGATPERLAIVGISIVHPSMLLFTRTGASFYLFAHALFWGVMAAALRYSESRQRRWLVAATLLVALFVANPYPPLAALPFALLFAFASSGRLAAARRNWRIYLAVGSAVALAALLTLGLGLAYDGSALGFAERVLRFQGERSASIGIAQLTGVDPTDKLLKWANQHFLFLVDDLGDPTRSDTGWTLNAHHAGFLGLLPVMAFGAVAGLRAHEPQARLAASVVAAFALVFLTVSFPEGRYTLALIPCYAAFAVRGVREAAGHGFAFPLALGVILSLLSLETQIHLARVYEPRSEEIWRPFDGIRELAPRLAAHAGRPVRVRLPGDPDYASNLYFRMVMDPAWRWLPADRFDATLDRQPREIRVVVVEAEAVAELAKWHVLGFAERTRLEAGRGSRPLVVLERGRP